MVDGQSLTVNRESFSLWLRHAVRERDAGSEGFSMGGRLLALRESARDETDQASKDWSHGHAMAADALDSPFKRAAATLSRDDLAAP